MTCGASAGPSGRPVPSAAVTSATDALRRDGPGSEAVEPLRRVARRAGERDVTIWHGPKYARPAAPRSLQDGPGGTDRQQPGEDRRRHGEYRERPRLAEHLVQPGHRVRRAEAEVGQHVVAGEHGAAVGGVAELLGLVQAADEAEPVGETEEDRAEPGEHPVRAGDRDGADRGARGGRAGPGEDAEPVAALRENPGGRLHPDARGERQRGHQPGERRRQGARAGHLLGKHDDRHRHRAEHERRGRRDREPERAGPQRGWRRPPPGGRPGQGRRSRPPDIRHGPDRGERHDAQHQMRQVRHDQRMRRPLRERRRHDGADPEPGAQRERRAARAQRAPAGQVLHPGGRRAEHHARAHAGERPPGRDQREVVRAEDEQQRGHRRQGRERQHARPAAEPVGQRSPGEQPGDERSRVDAEQPGDLGGPQAERLPVDDQHRRELVGAPAHREHGERDPEPGGRSPQCHNPRPYPENCQTAI